MKIDLKKFRRENNLIQLDVAKALKIAPLTYRKYEKSQNIPAVLYYRLHTLYPNSIKLPDDFYDYTPLCVIVNMAIYNISQSKLGKALDKPQCIISQLLNTDDSLYDYKEVIDKLFPVIYRPCIKENNEYKCIDTFQLKNHT